MDRTSKVDIEYSVTMAGVLLDQDTTHVLKTQSTRCWHQEWKALKRTKRSTHDYEGTDWLGTLSTIQSNKPSTRFSAYKLGTPLRSHRVKKGPGMLPTMDALCAKRPDLYKDDLCRQYGLVTGGQ